MTQTTQTRRPRKMAREVTDATDAANSATDATAAPSTATATPVPTSTASAPDPSASSAQTTTKPQTKASLVEELLRRESGASLTDLGEATGWLPHTCRAFLTGLRKKGTVVEKAKRGDRATMYRLVPVEDPDHASGAEAAEATA